jgi:hypothetical protein
LEQNKRNLIYLLSEICPLLLEEMMNIVFIAAELKNCFFFEDKNSLT